MSDDKQRTFIDQRYKFTPEELTQLNQQLVQLELRKKELLENRRETVAIFAKDLKNLERDIDATVQKLDKGFESRQIEVAIMLDTPQPGMKSYLDIAANKILENLTEPMSLQERQQNFGFAEEPGEGDGHV